MSEAKFVEEITQGLGSVIEDLHVSKIESPITSAGVPDLDIAGQGHEARVEVKFSFNGRAPEIRRTQVLWFKKRIAAGGCPWIMAKIKIEDEVVFYLVEGFHMQTLAMSSRIALWSELSEVEFPLPLAAENWRTIADRILT